MRLSPSTQATTTHTEKEAITENFIAAFIFCFVVIDPVGTSPVFLPITPHLNKHQKIRAALEDSFVASAITLFFALCGVWILHYLNISLTAFRLAGSIILLLVALDMLAKSYINPGITLVFSRITAFILAALSFHYIIDGLRALGVIQIIG